ncbi:Outer membrane lipoprotein OmlA [Altererythrobacter epoxidivorans]|uniref:Outer membrane lipoprotein OmlA n=2 Tax=Altererythrobacter epoxidivorans TaxID=361183 RepID=A0A0M4M9B6_9SPHN|nr:Outer membrane lipoprotein OmlA [Altererythrobacter epoxidivorans]
MPDYEKVCRSMDRAKAFKLGLVMAVGVGLAGCSSIREQRGYRVDPVLQTSIQPGVDNQQSVAGTLGRPSYVSEYGDQTWYYITSVTARKPFVRPSIQSHSVLAVSFDEAGNVAAADITGINNVARISPDGAETPTLGRERGFLEDLFGNIGQVGSAGMGAPQ